MRRCVYNQAFAAVLYVAELALSVDFLRIHYHIRTGGGRCLEEKADGDIRLVNHHTMGYDFERRYNRCAVHT